MKKISLSNLKKLSEKTPQKPKPESLFPLPVLKMPPAFWAKLEEYNALDPKLRAAKLQELGLSPSSNDALGIITKSHFVIPGKTRYKCQTCGECCRYARKVSAFNYEPCPYLTEKNLCARHDNRYHVCKWFPFWIHRDARLGLILTIKPFCEGFGKGELVDYEPTVRSLLSLRIEDTEEPDGAEVIHEVLYLPEKKMWVFPSRPNIDELMREIAQKPIFTPVVQKDGSRRETINAGLRLTHAHHYTSGLLGKITDPSLTVDERGVITEANEEFCALTEREREKLIDKPLSSLFVNGQSVERDITIIFSTGKVTASPHKLHKQSGEPSPVLLNAMVYRDYGDGMIHGALLCINEVSQAVYQELSQTKNYARALIEANLDMMLLLDLDGAIKDMNEAAVNMSGLSRNELLGSKFESLFTEPETARKDVLEAYEKGLMKNAGLVLLSKSGEETEVSANAVVFKDEEGIVRGLLVSAREKG